jgi:hypothetical protein
MTFKVSRKVGSVLLTAWREGLAFAACAWLMQEGRMRC